MFRKVSKHYGIGLLIGAACINIVFSVNRKEVQAGTKELCLNSYHRETKAVGLEGLELEWTADKKYTDKADTQKHDSGSLSLYGSQEGLQMAEPTTVVSETELQKIMADLGIDSSAGLIINTPGQWVRTEEAWQWVFPNGNFAKDSLIGYNGSIYGLDSSGNMYVGWVQEDGKWYYFEEDGRMHTGWLYLGGRWYWFAPGGDMAVGWCAINDLWYYFDESGCMLVDTTVEGCQLDPKGVYMESYAGGLETYAENYVRNVLEQLRDIYKAGLYWNHMAVSREDAESESGDTTLCGNGTLFTLDSITNPRVTTIPCNHYALGMKYCNYYIQNNTKGYQCDGFARMISDTIFGCDAPITEYAYDFSQVRIGDYIRYSSDLDKYLNQGHSAVVAGKSGDTLILLDVNGEGTCSISWDTKVSSAQLDGLYVKCFTRYR